MMRYPTKHFLDQLVTHLMEIRDIPNIALTGAERNSVSHAEVLSGLVTFLLLADQPVLQGALEVGCRAA